MRLCFLILAVWAAVGVGATASAQRAAPAFEAPLRAARAAYAAGRFAEARDQFIAADAAIGEERWDDEGNSLYTDAERTARESMRCAWGLSVLATLGARPAEGDASTDVAIARHEAISRAAVGCAPAEQAVVADMLGAPLAAALRLQEAGATSFPVPFASRRLSPAARTFAAAHRDGSFPAARGLTEATRFALAHMMATHGVASQCGEARGVRWTRPGQRLALPDDDSDEDWEEDASAEEMRRGPAPFSGTAPEALALLRCEYPPVMPPEDQGFGDGATGVAFLLRRDASGSVSIVASFDDFPSLDCWTGVVQGEVANYPIALPDGGHLYAFVRTSGYVGYDEDEASYVATTATLCDLRRGACRSLPIEVDRTALVVRGDDFIPVRSSWHARVVVARGRVRVSSVRGAPAIMRRFGRGVPLDGFFSSESTSAEERHLFPDGDEPDAQVARPSSSSECPWQIADADGQTNVRPGPSSAGAPTGTLATGTTIVPVERRGRWWRIEVPVAGWLWAPNLRQVCASP